MTDMPPAMVQQFVRGNFPPNSSSTRHSVYAEAEKEADVFKWVTSERAGRDLGEEALRQWSKQHWRPFVRGCWLQHLRGERYWAEVDRGDFGLLAGVGDAELIGAVVARLRDGWENLDVILWAQETRGLMDQVLAILEKLDINSRRLADRFDR